jgi:hypothetical protein
MDEHPGIAFRSVTGSGATRRRPRGRAHLARSASRLVSLLLDEMDPRLIARQLQARGTTSSPSTTRQGEGWPMRRSRLRAQAGARRGDRERPRPSPAGIGAYNRWRKPLWTRPHDAERWPRSNHGALIAVLNQLLKSTPEQPIDTELCWL